MPATDADWVLAVDVRGEQHATATAGPLGARLGRSEVGDRPPLAVVVVHPATWPAERVEAALADVAATAPAPDWPAPVPLTGPEAASWRALEFGLVPARGRLVVLDPLAREAVVVDRDGDSLAAVGAAVRLDGEPADAEHLVSLARHALDAAPAGPPFTGVLLAARLPGAVDDAELPGVIARVTGRSPLVPGDAADAAVLGAAALGWAAATATDEGPPPARPSAGPRLLRRPAGELPSAAPRGRLRGRGPLVWAGAALLVLVAIAVVAGLGWNRVSTRPSPYVVTCSNGEVHAYSYECPSPSP